MPRVQPLVRFRGLNTSAPDTGLEPESAAVLEGFRVSSGDLAPQPGRARLDQAASTIRAGEFAAASSHHYAIPNPAAAWTLRKNWTFRHDIEPDTVTGTQALVAFNHATAWPIKTYLDGSTLTVKVTDTADTVVTLTSTTTLAPDTVYAYELVRSGTTLTLYVNGSEEDSDTMADLDCKVPSSDLYFGRDDSGNYYDGVMDGPELILRDDLPTNRPLVRYQDPKGAVVRAWYDLNLDADDIAKDLSRHGNHARGENSVTDATALSHAYAPIHGISTFTTPTGEKRVVIGASGEIYIAEAV